MTDESWEIRHQEWRDRGNLCRECERIERSLDDPDAHAPGRSARALASAGSWVGVRPALLPWRASNTGRSRRSWDSGPDRSARPVDPRSLDELDRVVERLDRKVKGLLVRGPTQSRPEWEAHLAHVRLERDAAQLALEDKIADEARKAPGKRIRRQETASH